MDVRTWGRRLRHALVVCAVVLAGLSATAAAQEGDLVLATEVRGPITQVSADHLSDALAEAERRQASVLVVELDTPGGGLETTRAIVGDFLASDVPVVVHVSPSGARAGSAGTFITYAAHVAAMAPGTTIGAATPVDAEGGEVIDKIVNDTASWAQSLAEQRGRDPDFAEEAVRDGRSVTAESALELGAVDLLASSRSELLDEIDGMEVPQPDGGSQTLATAGASVEDFEMSWARSVLQTLANPQLAFIFLSIGTLAIIYELANPGAGIGGVIGAIMLVLAFYSLSVLPTNFAGVALLLLALGLLVAELFAPGVGVLAGGGALALVFAGLLLFDETQGISVSWGVLLPAALLAGLGAVGIAVVAARERGRPATMGEGSLVGHEGEVRRVRDRQAQVMVDGELWDAAPSGDGPALKEGQRVRVVGKEGLRLHVEAKEE